MNKRLKYDPHETRFVYKQYYHITPSNHYYPEPYFESVYRGCHSHKYKPEVEGFGKLSVNDNNLLILILVVFFVCYLYSK